MEDLEHICNQKFVLCFVACSELNCESGFGQNVEPNHGSDQGEVKQPLGSPREHAHYVNQSLARNHPEIYMRD